MIKFIYRLFGWCYHEYGEWKFVEGTSITWPIFNGQYTQERICKRCKWHDRKTRYY